MTFYCLNIVPTKQKMGTFNQIFNCYLNDYRTAKYFRWYCGIGMWSLPAVDKMLVFHNKVYIVCNMLTYFVWLLSFLKEYNWALWGFLSNSMHAFLKTDLTSKIKIKKKRNAKIILNTTLISWKIILITLWLVH